MIRLFLIQLLLLVIQLERTEGKNWKQKQRKPILSVNTNEKVGKLYEKWKYPKLSFIGQGSEQLLKHSQLHMMIKVPHNDSTGGSKGYMLVLYEPNKTLTPDLIRFRDMYADIVPHLILFNSAESSLIASVETVKVNLKRSKYFLMQAKYGTKVWS